MVQILFRLCLLIYMNLLDNFHPENSHVVAALISKFHNAVLSNKKTITLWGTGKPNNYF